jgi:hypothetical protein
MCKSSQGKMQINNCFFSSILCISHFLFFFQNIIESFCSFCIFLEKNKNVVKKKGKIKKTHLPWFFILCNISLSILLIILYIDYYSLYYSSYVIVLFTNKYQLLLIEIIYFYSYYQAFSTLSLFFHYTSLNSSSFPQLHPLPPLFYYLSYYL